jgi:hypothetical protein
MSELEKIILTSSLTVVGGIIIFVLGQLIVKFFIEPIHEQATLIGEISYALTFYANIYSNPGLGKPDDMYEASQTLRQLASRLRATTRAIRWYGLWQLLGIALKQKALMDVSTDLIGLSNGIYQGDPRVNNDRRERIKSALGIKYEI